MISDDDLLLYYYRDGLDSTGRARVATALAKDPELAQRLHRLVAQLDTAAEMPEVPVPTHVQQRWQAALAARARPRPSFRWQAIAATVALLAVLLTVWVSMKPAPEQVAHDASPAAAMPDPAAYERGLRWHLANTEQRLANLDTAQPDERARLIAAIVEQNRMYALAADRANSPQLARVLRAFTPILESLTDERRETSAAEIAQLSFEMRVMQARLKAEASPSSTAQPIAL
jgi:anti-sigma factor RsiW